MKYSKKNFNLTISIVFFLITHITEAYHIQVFSTLISSLDCWGWVIDPDSGHVFYDSGHRNCIGTCQLIDYNSPPPNGKFGVQIHEYKNIQDVEGEHDVCYEISGSEAAWELNEVDCNKFSGVSSCE
ncbi:623_t:CDS:2 [Funneliformis geosporum]|uniref:18786_t:CDS:1 n=1 Tax=Funneliformis geosporum TaxID=1117311 RepID=A0A9W4WL52_9GLOM|nr:623_t:CDS:2 [Funneliformis geosporum]CAI2170161.1 18786_t:CDS:2 [Funneliformis geosporum]